MQEIWKDIKGYEGLYQVSNIGNVRSLFIWNGHKYKKRTSPYMLSKSKTTTGYWKIELVKDKKKKSFKVHRLVATVFIPNLLNKDVINHKDFNPLNNNVDNLEWVTQHENIKYSSKNYKLGNVKSKNKQYEIIQYYLKPKRTSDVCKKYNITKSTLLYILKRHNITPHKFVKYNIDLNELKRDFDLGIKNKYLQIKYNCSKDIIATRKYQYKKGMI